MIREIYQMQKGVYVLQNPQPNQANEHRALITAKIQKIQMLSNSITAPMRKCRKFLTIVAILFGVALLTLGIWAGIRFVSHRKDQRGRRDYHVKGMKTQAFNETEFADWHHHHRHHGDHDRHHPKGWFNCTITKFDETNHDTDLSCNLHKFDKTQEETKVVNKPEEIKNPEDKAANSLKVQQPPKVATPVNPEDVPVKQVLPIPLDNLIDNKNHHPEFPIWVTINNQKLLLIKPHFRPHHHHHRRHFCPFLFLLRVVHILAFILIVGLIARCVTKRKHWRVMRRKLNKFINLENQDQSGIYIRFINPRELEIEIRDSNEIDNTINQTQMQIRVNPNLPYSNNNNMVRERNYFNVDRQNESLMSGRQNVYNPNCPQH